MRSSDPERFDHIDIAANVTQYSQALRADARYASWDYCYNYFQRSRASDRSDALAADSEVEASCMQLGFYLASWGMYRGSAALLQRSARALKGVVEAIVSAPDCVWTADADRYDDTTIDEILETARTVREACPNGASDTLVSKVMLGAFGCVPAFDTNFARGSGLSRFNESALRELSSYYERNSAAIEAARRPTLDFVSGQPTTVSYTRAKVIDMIFFTQGMR